MWLNNNTSFSFLKFWPSKRLRHERLYMYSGSYFRRCWFNNFCNIYLYVSLCLGKSFYYFLNLFTSHDAYKVTQIRLNIISNIHIIVYMIIMKILSENYKLHIFTNNVCMLCIEEIVEINTYLLIAKRVTFSEIYLKFYFIR